MFKPIGPWISLITLGLTFGLLTDARAQHRVDVFGDPIDQIDPLDFKDLAKERLAVASADPKELAKAMLDVARTEFEDRYKGFEGGRGTLDIVLGSASRWLESELALRDRAVDQLAAFERHWALAEAIDEINKARYEAGRISVQDYFQSTYFRLEAEIAVARGRARPEQHRTPAASAPLVGDLLHSKSIAKAKFKASLTNSDELARAKLLVARREWEARYQEYQAGRGTLELLTESRLRALESERAVQGKDVDPMAHLEKAWLQARQIDNIDKARWEARRVPDKTFAETTYYRLQAEIALIQARPKNQKFPSPLSAQRNSMGEILPESSLQSLHDKQLAKDKLKAFQADPKILAENKLEVARLAWRSRFGEFVAGRGTLDILLKSTQRLLDSERALSEDPAEHAAAYNRYWVRVRRIALEMKTRYEAGRIGIQDYLQSKYFLLQAEMWLIQIVAKAAMK